MGKIFIVYIMANRKHGALYTGVTSDPVGRVWQHKNHFFKGSFTERYGCDKLVWYELHEHAEAAITREKRIKQWHRPWKDRLIEAMNPDWRDLSLGWGFDADLSHPPGDLGPRVPSRAKARSDRGQA